MELLYIAVLPVIILLFYIYKKDIDKEPRGTLTKLFIFGGLSVIPIVIAEFIMADLIPGMYMPTFFGTFLVTFAGVGIIEEIGKWLIVYFCTYRRREYNHSYDGIVYAVFASLGFAAVENVFYVLQNGFGTGIMRALLAVPGHAVDAVFMGVLLSKSKKALVENDNSKSLVFLFLSIMFPAITHSIYDGLIFHYSGVEDTTYIVLFFAFVIVSYIVSFILIKNTSKIENNFDGTSTKVLVPQPNIPLHR